jgi:hypothetical protein
MEEAYIKTIGDLKALFFFKFNFEVDQFFFRNAASLLTKNEISIFFFKLLVENLITFPKC